MNVLMADLENPIDVAATDVPTARSEKSDGETAEALAPESSNVGELAFSEQSEVETAGPEDILNKETQLQHPLVSYSNNFYA